MIKNVRQMIFTFHNESDNPNNTFTLRVGSNMASAIISVTGDGVDFNLNVQAKSNENDSYSLISVIDLNTLDLSPQITQNGKYEMLLEGLTEIQIPLTEVASGEITVRATIIN